MIIHQAEHSKSVSNLLAMGLGSLLLIIASWIKIPFYPVPLTGHTLILFILALTQSPKNASGSALFYLLWASLGLPVFAGVSNSLWLFGKSAGYLLSFPIAAYLIAFLRQTFGPLIAIFAGQLVIYSCGFFGLLPFIGVSEAFMKGIVLFLPSALLKGLLAHKISTWINNGGSQ